MNYETYLFLKKTIMNAKKDLYTGIQQETLDKLLEKKYIEPNEYLKTKQAIENLKLLAYDQTDIIRSFEEKLSEEELFNVESTIIAKLLEFPSWDIWIETYYNINTNVKRNTQLSNIQTTNEIAKDFGFDNWHIFFNNYPYPISKENKVVEDMANN